MSASKLSVVFLLKKEKEKKKKRKRKEVAHLIEALNGNMIISNITLETTVFASTFCCPLTPH